MSQISRRNFMKCAGAAALAIAASGILTGCDNTLDVEVTFVYNGQTLPVTGTGKVVTGEQYMDTATIVLPAEYHGAEWNRHPVWNGFRSPRDRTVQ